MLFSYQTASCRTSSLYAVSSLSSMSPTTVVFVLELENVMCQQHEQKQAQYTTRSSLLISCWGMIVLHAELKSMNSILTWELQSSRHVLNNLCSIQTAVRLRAGS